MNEEKQFNPDSLDAELEEELRQMFAIDSREYLQTYITKAQQLKSESWKEDIQEMYRSIHTIKGNAVTVGADAILAVAIALEDLLSELRYQDAPPLEDGELSQKLLEAGELAVSSLEINIKGKQAQKIVAPSVNRIQELKKEIERVYLPDWNEQTLIQQEFAEQGFDLVVLDWEMGIENLSPEVTITDDLVAIATETLEQLRMIGNDIQLAEDWYLLIQECEDLIKTKNSKEWCEKFPNYFTILKECAKKGGILNVKETTIKPISSDSENLLNISQLQKQLFNSDVDIDINTEWDQENLKLETDKFDYNFDELESILDLERHHEIDKILEIEETEDDQSITEIQQPVNENKTTDINIPIPLNRIQKTSQSLVEVLLSNRTTISYYKNLQSQLVKLFTLAQDTNQYVTRLRQIQNDYALMESSRESVDSRLQEGLNIERYRQGYTTINHLLENSLRLSEVGAEAAKISISVADSFQHLELNLESLQESIDSSRLISFKNLCFRARAIIRDLSNRYHKYVQLNIEGENIDLDVGVNTKLESILLHLLRNAFDHGLENSDERLASGKSVQGTINLTLARKGNQYLLSIKDDGRGIDANKIKTIAEQKKLPLTNTSTPSQLLEVICQPGFSSKDTISDVSGRGVGMDVVNEQVKKLKGILTLNTIVGKSTTFNILIPVPHLFVPCVLMRSNHRLFAIPKEEVITTSLWSELQYENKDNKITLKTETDELEAIPILEYWQGKSNTDYTTILSKLSETAICLCVGKNHKERKIWLIADELQGQTELLLEPLPLPLIAPVGLIGVSLDTDGSLIPVISGVSIAEYYLNQNTVTDEASNDNKNSQEFLNASPITSSILIVDDAALMRRRIEASLKAYGYEVNTCEDGQQAWNWLQNNPAPRLIITDIEMPNMDGFTLIDYCRQAGMMFPILVISSRLSEDWGKEARRLGATDYLTKGFSTVELINKVNQFINS